MQKAPYDIVIFLVVVSGLILFLIAFIVSILYLYKKKQQSFEQSLTQLKLDHEKIILNTQLEIQEQTFRHISREIHDNINLSLTLAKLHLHTFDWNDKTFSQTKMDTSIELLSKSITELSDISKGLNADIIIQQGLLKAIDEEMERIRQAGLFTIHYTVTGTPVYLDNEKELILFRIIQEAFNNIIKHAKAGGTKLKLHYNSTLLNVSIQDNGTGFDKRMIPGSRHAGLKNMEARVKILEGKISIESHPGKGTSISIKIPINNT